MHIYIHGYMCVYIYMYIQCGYIYILIQCTPYIVIVREYADSRNSPQVLSRAPFRVLFIGVAGRKTTICLRTPQKINKTVLPSKG